MRIFKTIAILLAIIIMLSAYVIATTQDVDYVQEAFTNSYTYANKSDYANAIKVIRDVYDEKSYEMNLWLGWLNYSLGQYEESASYYQKAIDLKPNAIEPRLGYVKPAVALSTWDTETKYNKEVAKQCTEILKIDPNQTTANYRMGLICYNKTDYVNAQRYFEKVLVLYPSDYDSTIMLGQTMLKLKQPDDAKMLVKDEKLYETNLQLGWLNYLAGEYKDSISYYQQAIDLKHNSIEARLGYVNPAVALTMWDKVTAKYTEILGIYPKQTTANYRMGLVYYYKNDYINAQKYFEKVLTLYPFDYDSTIMMGWTMLKLNKPADAKVFFNKALLVKPGDKSALEGIASIK